MIAKRLLNIYQNIKLNDKCDLKNNHITLHNMYIFVTYCMLCYKLRIR